LSADARRTLRQQLQRNLIAIQESFAGYIDCIQQALVEKGVRLQRLKSYLVRLPCVCGDQNFMLLSSKKDDIEEAVDIYDLFMKLDGCTSFLNCFIFEKIVIQFKIDEGQESLQYPKELRRYVEKHTISQFIEVHPVLNNYTDGTKKLVLILDIELTCKFSKLVDIGHSVARLMNMDECALLIHNVGKHCVIATFLIHSLVADKIFTGPAASIFSIGQKDQLRNLSVLQLKCNGYDFNIHLNAEVITNPEASLLAGIF
jgi:hypothetical protein